MTEKQSKDAKSTRDAPESAQAAEASGDRARTAGLPAEKTAESCPCGCNRDESAALFDTMPDEELLYDLADLFKVFADTTRIKILYALMGQESVRGRSGRAHRCHAERGFTSAAHPQAGATREVPARRQKRHLLAFRRPRLHHARPGYDAHLRVNRTPRSPDFPQVARQAEPLPCAQSGGAAFGATRLGNLGISKSRRKATDRKDISCARYSNSTI